MSQHQSTLGPGRIQFHQWCEPPIEPKDYTVVVTQAVDQLDSNPYESKFEFSVAGPRFSLSPSEVYSVYPPKGQIGAFANTLPHVVFTRRTLPWERSITTDRKKGDRRPWMALLVFSASDFADAKFPEIVPRTLGELVTKTGALGKGVVGPKIDPMIHSLETVRLQDYERPKDLCTTIDIPWEVFQKAAPTWDDVEFLGHVREVNTGAKETSSMLADGWFSVVLANRFPEPERKNTNPELARFSQKVKNDEGVEEPPSLAVENRAYLVSLEAMQDYLPRPGGAAKAAPSGVTHVRLAVLSNWSFQCRAAFTFKSSVAKLDVGRLALPWNGGPDVHSDDPEEVARIENAKDLVKAAYQRGYSALNHLTRFGEKTVSWYRGPLVPLYLRKETSYSFRPVADAALRYDPLDGMMDVTYAGAFQLGRLIALQDRHFATALYSYRTGVRRQMNDFLSKKRLESALKAKDSAGRESDLMSAFLTRDKTPESKTSGWVASEEAVTSAEDRKNAVVAAAKAIKAAKEAATPAAKKAAITAAAKAKKNAIAAAEKAKGWSVNTDFDLTIPLEVTKWLGRLMLLYRVPFTYLVPDERMLPNDSIRFFYLDPGWLKCLLEGACSVGRSSSRDELVDKELRDNFLEFAIEDARALRQQTAVTEPRKAKAPPEKGVSWPMLTGFLLRSSIVEGWQGLEMRAWEKWDDQWIEDPNNPKWNQSKSEKHKERDGAKREAAVLKPLRLDRLGPDIMFCIFEGQVNYIEIKQPPEGMHFGAAKDADCKGYSRHHLRWLREQVGGGLRPGDQMPPETVARARVVLRDDGASRVVNVTKYTEKLASRLEIKAGEFTSAHFGVEMVESPGRAWFDRNYQKNPTVILPKDESK